MEVFAEDEMKYMTDYLGESIILLFITYTFYALNVIVYILDIQYILCFAYNHNFKHNYNYDVYVYDCITLEFAMPYTTFAFCCCICTLCTSWTCAAYCIEKRSILIVQLYV